MIVLQVRQEMVDQVEEHQVEGLCQVVGPGVVGMVEESEAQEHRVKGLMAHLAFTPGIREEEEAPEDRVQQIRQMEA